MRSSPVHLCAIQHPKILMIYFTYIYFTYKYVQFYSSRDAINTRTTVTKLEVA